MSVRLCSSLSVKRRPTELTLKRFNARSNNEKFHRIVSHENLKDGSLSVCVCVYLIFDRRLINSSFICHVTHNSL